MWDFIGPLLSLISWSMPGDTYDICATAMALAYMVGVSPLGPPPILPPPPPPPSPSTCDQAIGAPHYGGPVVWQLPQRSGWINPNHTFEYG